MPPSRPLAAFAAIAVACAGLAACPPARAPDGAAGRSPAAQKWLDRAQGSYRAADVDDAWDSVRSALAAAPDDAEVRTWGGRIALARLEFAEALRLLRGVDTGEARGLRGRALWYAGDMDAAADELEALLQNPDVRDGWAKGVSGLARRGVGRKPFQMSGGLLGVAEMPHVLGTALVVPLEIDGEQALALVASGSAEVVLDSTTRREPAWVNLRFGGRLEVKDVPALVQDLSGISQQMQTPIRALLGVNLLRHANVTVDFTGLQFVARSFAPPPPPRATRVPLYYVRGGGMLVRSAFRGDREPPAASLLVDTTMSFPVLLDDGGLKKAGLDAARMAGVPGDAKLRRATVPVLRLGGYDVVDVEAFWGAPIAELEKGLDVDLDGVLGAGLLAAFRVTIGEEGRAMWLERVDVPELAPLPPAPVAPAAPAGAGSAAAPASSAPAARPPAGPKAAAPGARPGAAPVGPAPKPAASATGR